MPTKQDQILAWVFILAIILLAYFFLGNDIQKVFECVLGNANWVCP